MVNADDLPLGGRLVGNEHRLPVRVYFEDTDAGGVVYHANFLRYMERGRVEMMRLLAIDHAGALMAGEGMYVVADIAIRYRASARLDDGLVVATRVSRIGGSSIGVHQRVMRGADTVSEADVTLVYVTPAGRPRRPPEAWIDIFQRLIEVETAS